MPTLLQINVTANWGSTGKIVEGIGNIAISTGWNSFVAYGRYMNTSSSKLIKIGNKWDIYIHGIISRIFDNHGLVSQKATQKLIKKIEEIKPDIIHLHNIHGYYINYQVLFDYLSTINIPIVWTLHDCWAFTGHCAHFVTIGCEKWKSGCHDCPLLKTYPKSLFFDRSKKNFEEKRKYFQEKTNPHIIVPSYWLMNIVKQSFLKDKHIKVINNGIDLNDFHYSEKKAVDSRKKKILGVSNVWNEDKGFNDFLLLRTLLPIDKYDIILVGLNKKQIGSLPKDIVGIERMNSVNGLAELYSQADVYVNLTHADTFPTTNLEALACGTPIVTYRIGGSPEAIDDRTGKVVEEGDINAVKNAIESICDKGKDHYRAACRKRAEDNYDKNDKFNEYFKLYNQLLNTHE